METMPFWWYQDFPRFGNTFALPFRDDDGVWWYPVRPGFAWPADAIDPLPVKRRRMPFRKTYLAYQHVVVEGGPTNSSLVVNTLLDLSTYGMHSIDDKRRNAIRKGMRACEVVAVDRIEDRWVNGLAKSWNDLVVRTGWKGCRTPAMLRDTLSRALELPASTLLVAFDRATGQVAGFLLTKVFGETAYVDTIASNSELLASNPNDATLYVFIRNAQRLGHVRKVHYAIKSDVEHLEKFKRSLGFVPHPFPANFHTRPGMLTLLRVVKPAMYQRLTARSVEGRGLAIVDDNAEILVRAMSTDEVGSLVLDQVVAIHQRTFPRGVLASTGPAGLREYYASIIESPWAKVYLALHGRRVVGIAAGTANRHSPTHRRRVRAVLNTLPQTLLSLRIGVMPLARAIRKRQLAANITDEAELLSLAVLPEYRRHGVGRKLLDAWSGDLRQRGGSSFIVFTDNPEGLRFYAKIGAECLFRFRMGLIESAAFRVSLSSVPAGPASAVTPETSQPASSS
jgi:ribosomal protein S18 acetylase RimI-like enzyme